MNKAIRWTIFCLASISLFADTPLCPDGKHWAPVPAGVWDTHTEPMGTNDDAIILDYQIIFDQLKDTSIVVTQSQRIRIQSESGKAATLFEPFGNDVFEIKGRIILPNGSIINIDSIKDFQKKEIIRTSINHLEVIKLFPPGITNNCIMDIQWKEMLKGSFYCRTTDLHAQRLTKFNRISSNYLIKNLSVNIDKKITSALLCYNSDDCKYTFTTMDNYKIFTWRNIPPDLVEPFSMSSVRPAVGFSFVRLSPAEFSAAKISPQAFWDVYGETTLNQFWIKQTLKPLWFKKTFSEFLENLPTSPQARAVEIARRIQNKIYNLENLTFSERSSLSRPAGDVTYSLGNMMKYKQATRFGLRLLFLNLLNEAELPIQPKVLAVSNREFRILDFNEFNTSQIHDFYIGINEVGKETLWIDPSLRFCKPGLMLAVHQGVPPIEYDTQSWKAKNINIPIQSMGENQLCYEYKIDITKDADQFIGKNEFYGLPAYYRRNDLARFAEDEQIRQIKEYLESEFTGLTCKVKIQNALDIANPLIYKIEGQIEREPTKRREVTPFPGMEFPFSIPARFPEKRNTMMVLPYALIHTATSTFKVPQGYEMVEPESLDRTNSLGRVVWKTDKGSDGTISITLRVELQTVVLPATEYPAMQSFLGWVKDAFTRTLVIKKS